MAKIIRNFIIWTVAIGIGGGWLAVKILHHALGV